MNSKLKPTTIQYFEEMDLELEPENRARVENSP